MIAPAYPATAAGRTRWIVEKRGPGNAVTADRPYAFLSEQERSERGEIEQAATIFLTNRECPWKCVMCDLWRNTAPAPAGSIPKQIRHALEKLPAAAVLKLYNSGSFFDAGAIPKSDWPEIAAMGGGFRKVILECHPRLAGPPVLEFAGMLGTNLEIAMGLETAHPAALERLNKRITLDHFQSAAAFLRSNGISIRAFLLVGVPFIRPSEQTSWVQKSIETAFHFGASVVSLIPTRAGNGALDALQRSGEFHPPSLGELESAHDYAVALGRGRAFADTWDLEQFSGCDRCLGPRRERLDRMNLSQQLEPHVACVC